MLSDIQTTRLGDCRCKVSLRPETSEAVEDLLQVLSPLASSVQAVKKEDCTAPNTPSLDRL